MGKHKWFNKPVLIRFVSGREVVGHFHSTDDGGVKVWSSIGRPRYYHREDIKSVVRLYEEIKYEKPPLGVKKERIWAMIRFLAPAMNQKGDDYYIIQERFGTIVRTRGDYIVIEWGLDNKRVQIFKQNILEVRFG